jgi:homeobox protein cut-like
MVTAQRDRFKKKITELEAELQSQYRNVSSLRSEVATLQTDNLTLYEKTRYVSSYARGPMPTSSGAAYGVNANPSSIPISPGGENPPGMERYRSAYESNLSPFAAFRGRESARVMKRMSVLERGVYQITRLVLATRTSRNLFAVYCLGLHLLVFFMLFGAGASAEKMGPVLATAGSAGGGWREEAFEAAVEGPALAD